ncbi:hypothetical protein FA15DRAFT_744014 [Coprinopsis marcescibilis]|uniref:Uncharacterized protein n=1 Tax=Coprinopsis marcescibilis TaxID=230819 RepID=A0A5C3KTW9_COPMA|nr:hypothetical protein FA15DRAFT_744014 [Coprinopsis marcescibilis]
MASIEALPTELLSAIFTLSINSTLAATRPTSKEFYLPSLTTSYDTVRNISTTCTSWRRISCSLKDLWTRVHLDTAMEISAEAIQDLHAVFARSNTRSLHFDFTGPSGRSNIINNAKKWASLISSDAANRCKSLRIACSSEDAELVLKLLSRYGPPKRLQCVHIIQESGSPTIDLSLVDYTRLQLLSVRGDGVLPVGLPHWGLDNVVLQDVSISQRELRMLITAVAVRHLTLRRVQVPPGLDFDTATPDDYAEWLDYYASHARLEYLELDDIIDEFPTTSSPNLNHASFARHILIPYTARTLKRVKLTNVSTVMGNGLASLWDQPLLAYPEVKRVVIRFKDENSTASLRNAQIDFADVTKRVFPRAHLL